MLHLYINPHTLLITFPDSSNTTMKDAGFVHDNGEHEYYAQWCDMDIFWVLETQRGSVTRISPNDVHYDVKATFQIDHCDDQACDLCVPYVCDTCWFQHTNVELFYPLHGRLMCPDCDTGEESEDEREDPQYTESKTENKTDEEDPQ